MLLIQTAGAGSDTDAQAHAMAAIQHAFQQGQRGSASGYRLSMTGPGVFAVETRDTIKHDVQRLSTVSIALIVGLLLVVYRSLPTLLLGLLPVLSGVAAGIATVSLVSGTVHGLTLGFGTTLDWRGGRLPDLPLRAVVADRIRVTRGERHAPVGGHILADHPARRADIRMRLCVDAFLRFPRPGPARPLFDRRPKHRCHRHALVLPHLLGRNFAIRDVSRAGMTLSRVG